ncbi:MAG TPA: hypothetical protein V6D05_12210 [Stenomitos sp.]
MEQDDRIDRHAFVQAGLSGLGKGLGGFLGAWLGMEPPPAPVPPRVLRPPGALPEEAFLRACTRCDACAAACPAYAIKVAGRADGVAVGTPFMHDLAGSPCLLCPDTPCIRACVPGALQPTAPHAIRLGRAEVAPDRCHAHQGTACRACVDACPVGEQGIVLWEGRPMVVPLGCTGCGQCLSACPAEPRAIAVLPTA